MFVLFIQVSKGHKNLEQQRLEIETEELRMFDFLHTLGETLTEEGEPIQGLYIEQS